MGITCTPHIYRYDITCSSAFQILNFGLGACATKKILLFSLTFTERPPFLPTFTQWPPIFNKLLVIERPWYIFVTQRPLIFTFNSQTSDNFRQKIGFLLRKFRENFEKFLAILALKSLFFFFLHFTERPPFLCVLSLKGPLFWCNLSPKDPYIWGAWWHLYATFICECPPQEVEEVIDIEYNKRLDRQRPCLEDDLTAGSNL